MYCFAAGGYRVKTGFFGPGADALCRNDGSLGPLGRRGRCGGWGSSKIFEPRSSKTPARWDCRGTWPLWPGIL